MNVLVTPPNPNAHRSHRVSMALRSLAEIKSPDGMEGPFVPGIAQNMEARKEAESFPSPGRRRTPWNIVNTVDQGL